MKPSLVFPEAIVIPELPLPSITNSFAEPFTDAPLSPLLTWRLPNGAVSPIPTLPENEAPPSLYNDMSLVLPVSVQ